MRQDSLPATSDRDDGHSVPEGGDSRSPSGVPGLEHACACVLTQGPQQRMDGRGPRATARRHTTVGRQGAIQESMRPAHALEWRRGLEEAAMFQKSAHLIAFSSVVVPALLLLTRFADRGARDAFGRGHRL
jgi:hypothetical protein